MDDETQKRVIMILASAIAYVLASRLSERFVEQPEVRGIRDDLKEALLSAASSLLLTIIASLVIRRVIGSR
jgi:peptidoglycan/LPS O-acetylase OafA/YrhL